MIYTQINSLIEQAITAKLMEEEDRNYATNQVLAQLHLTSKPEVITETSNEAIPDLLDKLVEYAITQEIIEDVFDDKEILAANIMNIFVARPSTINHTFRAKYEQSPELATDYFYTLSQNSNYIQMNRIKKNIHFKADTVYGEMDITINMSKPEKDPKQIEREKHIKQAIHYPKCVLCVENEGYEGRTAYPARANHRVVHVPLVDEDWYLQYSPYVYYNEHSILLSKHHEDMVINKKTFQKLLAFVDKFPHYFIGSNADLPIVGGSILSHNHFQAGRYTFPMENAPDLFSFAIPNKPGIVASVVNWPLTTIRMQSTNQVELVETAAHILATWQTYNDEQAGIQSSTDGIPHNTITPIARMRDNTFELDLVLRNNRTTAEFPDGIFHPHADVHHIKKENIGLIEVMGLAVLPARLHTELTAIKQQLTGENVQVEAYHQAWTNELVENYGANNTIEQANQIIEKELGNKFARVLKDAGVLKDEAASKRFIQTLFDK